MPSSFVTLPPPESAKADTWLLTVGINSVHREVDRIGGEFALEIADVKGTDPAAAAYGLVVRDAPPVNLQVDYATSASLAPGASIDLDAGAIGVGTTGKLMRVLVGSSAPCQWEIKTRDGAVEVVKAVIFTGGLGNSPTDRYKPENKEGVTLAYGDGNENFRVTATNLGSSGDDADVHVTTEWDEV